MNCSKYRLSSVVIDSWDELDPAHFGFLGDGW
jgi:hypothetical protein